MYLFIYKFIIIDSQKKSYGKIVWRIVWKIVWNEKNVVSKTFFEICDFKIFFF